MIRSGYLQYLAIANSPDPLGTVATQEREQAQTLFEQHPAPELYLGAHRDSDTAYQVVHRIPHHQPLRGPHYSVAQHSP